MALLISLSLPALGAADMPRWYGGQHAVLIVVDGLGDGAFDRLRQAGHLKRTGQRFVDDGLRMTAVAAAWPSRGSAEGRSVGRGQLLSFDADDSYAAPGLESWPQGSFAAYGGDRDDGLKAAIGDLRGLANKQLPPVLILVHERRYAKAIGRSGAQSVQAGQALSAIDTDLAALLEVYRKRGLLGDTTVALISPAAVEPAAKKLNPELLFKDFRGKRLQRSARLSKLLKTFEPVEIETSGALAMISTRPAKGAPESSPPPTVHTLLRAAGIKRNRGAALIDQLTRAEGVALVISRERASDTEVIGVQSRSGKARLELRAPDQIRYKVLRGRDPLQLGSIPAAFDSGRFHAAAVWRAASIEQPLADMPTRASELLRLLDRAALAVVARSGHSFDRSAVSSGPSAKALALWSGPGLRGVDDRPARSIDVVTTLLALVGAPLDDRLEGDVLEPIIEASTPTTIRSMCRIMVQRSVDAFSPSRIHNASIIDTTEIRRFGTPPKYFAVLQQGLLKDDPLRYLPEERIQSQIGPRRSLLIAVTALSARVERLILRKVPNEIRRFDPLIRPEFMLAGFLEDPRMRSRLRVLEGPRQRSRARAVANQAKPATASP